MNTCVYINKKIEFCSGSIRCQVYEMWSQGDRVACGVITDDTKVCTKLYYILHRTLNSTIKATMISR